ncbi:hypothetical protein SAMN06298216_0784 [Spirosomataceae bacterium TFI 002]|nr:hypothetical protein SAMN06298216_0784 [Spirosomataceae bacterium TFI 002]
MKNLEVNSDVFKSVISEIKESQEYRNEHYRSELEEVVQVLSENYPSQLVGRIGEKHYPISKKIARLNARQTYYDLLQKHSHYEFTLKSKPLNKIAKIIDKYLRLYHIGNPFSYQDGNFLIYIGEVNPNEFLRILDYPSNLVPHTWRDVKTYREKGIIDIETGEGIIGTEIPDRQNNLLISKDWEYRLIDNTGKYIFQVMCGTVANYWFTTHLTIEERNELRKQGIKFLDELGEKIRYSPSKFEDRRIEYDR